MLQCAAAKVDGTFFVVVVFLFFWKTSATPPPLKSEHNALRARNEEAVSQAVLLSLSTLDERPK